MTHLEKTLLALPHSQKSLYLLDNDLTSLKETHDPKLLDPKINLYFRNVTHLLTIYSSWIRNSNTNPGEKDYMDLHPLECAK